MDTNNPVVQLCSQGMQAEAEGRNLDARDLFMQAWEISKDDYDACVAAHFVARHQPEPEEMLKWNQEALKHADAVADDRVKGFYPSLYLNIGYSYEKLGNNSEAKRYYDLAAELSDVLSDGQYGDVVRGGIAEGQKRVGPSS